MRKYRPSAPRVPGRSEPARRPVVMVYLATAAPIEHAEAELRLRLKKNPHPMPEPDPDYLEYLSDHRDENLVLAITYPTLAGLGDAAREQADGRGIGHAGRQEELPDRRAFSADAVRPGAAPDLPARREDRPTRRWSSGSIWAASNSPNAKSSFASRILLIRASWRCNPGYSQLRITLPELPELIASKPFSNSV